MAITTSAFAIEPYIGVAGGVSIINDSEIDSPDASALSTSYDKGIGLHVNGGTRFYGGRTEWEFGYKKAGASEPDDSTGVNGADLTIMSYMINGYLENRREPEYTPYLGAGIGFINGEFDDKIKKMYDTVLGYQVIVGAEFKIIDNIFLDISYRYQGTAKKFNIDNTEIPYSSSNIYTGIKFNFFDD